MLSFLSTSYFSCIIKKKENEKMITPIQEGRKNMMNTVEIEQLKNDLEVKVGILEMKIKSGKITDDTASKSVELFKEYEQHGTTIEELKLLFDDVMLALS